MKKMKWSEERILDELRRIKEEHNPSELSYGNIERLSKYPSLPNAIKYRGGLPYYALMLGMPCKESYNGESPCKTCKKFECSLMCGAYLWWFRAEWRGIRAAAKKLKEKCDG